MMRLLLDTNVILDVLLNRAPWVDDATVIWQACDDEHSAGYVVATTLTDIFYIAQRIADQTKARQAVRVCLDAFTVCAVDQRVLEHAYSLAGSDFEDNIQIACAALSGLDAIVTRNTDDFAASSVPVYTPAEWSSGYSPPA
jgi:predicted nucleic acid-binding protein